MSNRFKWEKVRKQMLPCFSIPGLPLLKLQWDSLTKNEHKHKSEATLKIQALGSTCSSLSPDAINSPSATCCCSRSRWHIYTRLLWIQKTSVLCSFAPDLTQPGKANKILLFGPADQLWEQPSCLWFPGDQSILLGSHLETFPRYGVVWSTWTHALVLKLVQNIHQGDLL